MSKLSQTTMALDSLLKRMDGERVTKAGVENAIADARFTVRENKIKDRDNKAMAVSIASALAGGTLMGRGGNKNIKSVGAALAALGMINGGLSRSKASRDRKLNSARRSVNYMGNVEY